MIARWMRHRPVSGRQRILPFLERQRLLDRWFKRIILVATCIAVVAMLRAFPWGRYLSADLYGAATRVGRMASGLPMPRPKSDESWRRFRERQIEDTRPMVEQFYAECAPKAQAILRYAAMDPEHGLLRWGNYNWTLLLSSAVFEADSAGRSYRFRPHTRSIWLHDVPVPRHTGPLKFFLVPDGPGLAETIRGTTARILKSSTQTTNSWGLRGPEPDRTAPVRGIVLGDSYMQGALIADDETPPECLKRDLQSRLKSPVSILNTGVLGYSPEQYYYSLIAFAGRFRPQFVVVSLYTNDFGNSTDVESRGEGDWYEAKYWLDRIADYCHARGCPLLIVPVPYRGSVVGRRVSNYLGPLLKIVNFDSRSVLDPLDDFVNAHLKQRAAAHEIATKRELCALFNDDLDDKHFSAAGAKVWAEAVGERVRLLLSQSGNATHELN
jgi:hypothetical protein